MFMNNLPECVLSAWCLQRLEKDITSLGNGVRDGYGSPCGCWEPNSSPLQEPPALLTAEPLPQPEPSRYCRVLAAASGLS